MLYNKGSGVVCVTVRKVLGHGEDCKNYGFEMGNSTNGCWLYGVRCGLNSWVKHDEWGSLKFQISKASSVDYGGGSNETYTIC